MAKSCRTSPSVHHCTVAPRTPNGGGGASSTGKSKEAVNSLKSAASGLIPEKREATSSLIEEATLTQASGSTSSVTQANCDISSMRRRTVRDERLTLSKTERCSGHTESTTATWHSLMKSPSENGFIQRARMRERHNWHALSCRHQQFACGRTKLFSAGCLTIYRWRLSSPQETSTRSLMLAALPPSGVACLQAYEVLGCPKRPRPTL